VDKSITFHYCTVIGDVLWPIDVIFLKDNTNCIWFLLFNFFKVGKFATQWTSKSQKCLSVSEGLCPFDLLTRGSAPGPRWGTSSWPPIIGASHLYLGGLQL